ncbi:hypothetical protein AURDEDRAFT_177907, partial [Auricularia subglabra TFB-10046 SS5]
MDSDYDPGSDDDRGSDDELRSILGPNDVRGRDRLPTVFPRGLNYNPNVPFSRGADRDGYNRPDWPWEGDNTMGATDFHTHVGDLNSRMGPEVEEDPELDNDEDDPLDEEENPVRPEDIARVGLCARSILPGAHYRQDSRQLVLDGNLTPRVDPDNDDVQLRWDYDSAYAQSYTIPIITKIKVFMKCDSSRALKERISLRVRMPDGTSPPWADAHKVPNILLATFPDHGQIYAAFPRLAVGADGTQFPLSLKYPLYRRLFRALRATDPWAAPYLFHNNAEAAIRGGHENKSIDITGPANIRRFANNFVKVCRASADFEGVFFILTVRGAKYQHHFYRLHDDADTLAAALRSVDPHSLNGGDNGGDRWLVDKGLELRCAGACVQLALSSHEDLIRLVCRDVDRSAVQTVMGTKSLYQLHKKAQIAAFQTFSLKTAGNADFLREGIHRLITYTTDKHFSYNADRNKKTVYNPLKPADLLSDTKLRHGIERAREVARQARAARGTLEDENEPEAQGEEEEEEEEEEEQEQEEEQPELWYPEDGAGDLDDDDDANGFGDGGRATGPDQASDNEGDDAYLAFDALQNRRARKNLADTMEGALRIEITVSYGKAVQALSHITKERLAQLAYHVDATDLWDFYYLRLSAMIIVYENLLQQDAAARRQIGSMILGLVVCRMQASLFVREDDGGSTTRLFAKCGRKAMSVLHDGPVDAGITPGVYFLSDIFVDDKGNMMMPDAVCDLFDHNELAMLYGMSDAGQFAMVISSRRSGRAEDVPDVPRTKNRTPESAADALAQVLQLDVQVAVQLPERWDDLNTAYLASLADRHVSDIGTFARPSTRPDMEARTAHIWVAWCRDCFLRGPNGAGGYLLLTAEQMAKIRDDRLLRATNLGKVLRCALVKVLTDTEWRALFNRFFPQTAAIPSGQNYGQWGSLDLYRKTIAAESPELVECIRDALWLYFNNLVWAPNANASRIWDTRKHKSSTFVGTTGPNGPHIAVRSESDLQRIT